jgi:CRP-like cAMP-binding protein
MTQEASQYFFSSQPVLESLPQRDLRRLREHLHLKKVKKGKELFKEGTYPRAVYIVKRGKVKLFQQGQNGSETIVTIYSSGEMFGYRPILCNEKNPASAQTLEDCAIYVLPARHFVQLLSVSTTLSNLLLRNLSHEFRVLVNKIGAFAQKSVRERTALSLLILGEKYNKPGSKDAAEITLSRHDLAAFVGTTIETIARILRRLKEDKIIKTFGRKIVIQNPRALQQLAD